MLQDKTKEAILNQYILNTTRDIGKAIRVLVINFILIKMEKNRRRQSGNMLCTFACKTVQKQTKMAINGR